jgi:hypothetical protein
MSSYVERKEEVNGTRSKFFSWDICSDFANNTIKLQKKLVTTSIKKVKA